jgi:hypothetical protein
MKWLNCQDSQNEKREMVENGGSGRYLQKREKNCRMEDMATETIQNVKKKYSKLNKNHSVATAKSIAMQNKVLDIVQKDPTKPICEAMVAVGYSESTARNPSRYIGRENLLKAFSKAIPDKLILKAHKKLLKAKTRTKTYVKGEFRTEVVSEDAFALSKGVELAYRVKGSFAPEEKELSIRTGLEAKNDDELDEIIKQNEALLSRREQFAKDKPVIEGEILANTTP